MKAKVSKAQEEVWEWKESAMKKLENIPEDERVKYILEKHKMKVDKIQKKKRQWA